MALALSFVQVPRAYSAELTAPEKALAILTDVVGLDMAAYRTNLKKYNDLTPYRDVLPQEIVVYTLESNESKLELSCTFTNGNLRVMIIDELEGSPRMTQPVTDVLEMAKSFLSRYQTYSGASQCEALRYMLDTIDARKNVTKTSGEQTLEVTVDQESTSFRWTYTFNGVQAASRCVVLCFDNGFMSYFIDTWRLYEIGSYDINLSEDEAINIAMDRAKNFSWRVRMDNDTWMRVTEFSISKVSRIELSFLNEIYEKNARGGDPLTLYPMWVIRLNFDKIFPSNIYGVIVGIWADTKEVSYISTASFGGAPPSDEEVSIDEVNTNQIPITWITLPISIAISFGATKVYFRRKKSNSLKLGGALLCFLILLITCLIPIATAYSKENLPYPGGGAITYASTWGQSPEEILAAEQVCKRIVDDFSHEGYNATNAYGNLTQVSNVLQWAYDMEHDYHHVAVFHYGHGYGNNYEGVWHRSYADNNGYESGDLIWDWAIYSQTSLGKNVFVFIWACMQGHEIGNMSSNGAWGMPFAWLHTNNLSPDGYANPDSGPYCFIGFDGVSPPLSEAVFSNSDVKCKDFIMLFYDYALKAGFSINDALDLASIDLFQCYYDETELYTGFRLYTDFSWLNPKMKPDWYQGWMKIYGNGNIHLNQLEFTVLAKDQYESPLVNKDVYIDNTYQNNIADTGSPIWVTEGSHTVFVNDFWEAGYTGYRYTFQYYTIGDTQYSNNPLTLNFSSDTTITAHFSKTRSAGDVDGNGDADLDDHHYHFVNAYPSERGDPNWDSRCDFNNDGAVDRNDEGYLIMCIKTQQSEPFPITWIVATIVTIVIVGATLLVYFKRIKKTTVKAEK